MTPTVMFSLQTSVMKPKFLNRPYHLTRVDGSVREAEPMVWTLTLLAMIIIWLEFDWLINMTVPITRHFYKHKSTLSIFIGKKVKGNL